MVDDYLDASRDFDVLERLTDEFFAKYEPDLFRADDALVMLERITKTGRLYDAGKMRTARRLEKADSYKDQGYKDAASWFSSITGESVGQAASKLDTARSVEAHPYLQEALNSGKVSLAQAKQIASAADRCPEEALELIDMAPAMSYGQLRRACDGLRSGSESASEEIARHERIRKTRFCRTWTDSDGAGHLEAKMTPDALAVILAGLGNFEARIFEDARKSGQRESHQAYLLDALVAMAAASGTGTSVPESASPESDSQGDSKDPGATDAGDHKPNRRQRRKTSTARALVRIRLDLEALLRGHAIVGETCSIPGIGPVPVAAARALLGEAILELVITKGVDVTTVVSDSRYVRKALRIALEERDPVCVVPGCDRSDPLERDHWRIDFGADGPTSIDNLARLCPFHHDQKTHRGWVLDGGPGQWRFFNPDRTPVADGTPGAEPESESEVADTAGERQARRRATPANDPPEQQPLL